VTVRGTLGRVGGELIIAEPETDRSRRSVPLSAPLVAMLRVHRANQHAERHVARDQWQDNDLVCATESGTPVDPRNVLRTIQIAAQKTGMADVKVHTLRHSAARAWLEGQVHIKAVADRLGHSSIAVTGDIYGHTSDTTARHAVDALADRLGILGVYATLLCHVAIRVAIQGNVNAIEAAPDLSETASVLVVLWSG
jgi:integrase